MVCLNLLSFDTVTPLQDGAALVNDPAKVRFAQQAMICAKAILDCSLNPQRRAPRQGLAIDFALTGMGFALSHVLALGEYQQIFPPLSWRRFRLRFSRLLSSLCGSSPV